MSAQLDDRLPREEPQREAHLPIKTSSQTMLRGLSILEYVAAHTESVAVGEVTEALGLEKSTTSRLLAALRTAGYVRQRKDRSYQLTPKLLFLTRNFVPAEHLREASRAAVEELHESLDEAVHLAAIDGGEIVFVDFLDSSHAVRSQTPTTPSPLHLTAIGRAALSSMAGERRSTALRESAIAAGVPGDTIDLAELEESFRLARSRGFVTYTAGDDVVRIAAAITSATGEPIGGLSVSGPEYRLRDRIEEIGRLVRTAVERIHA